MATRQLFVHQAETSEQALRRENAEAPFGRCGDRAKPGEYPGCGEPIVDSEWYVCRHYPDCCRP
jgi:hypothetical protein